MGEGRAEFTPINYSSDKKNFLSKFFPKKSPAPELPILQSPASAETPSAGISDDEYELTHWWDDPIDNQSSMEIVDENNIKYKNLLGEDTRKRGYKTHGGNNESIYIPTPRSLVNENGFSIVSPDYFKEALIEPISERHTTEMIVPLNKIIALDTTEDNQRSNRNQDRLPWEIDSHISVEEVRKLIKENKFDFNNTGGLIGLELPGGYILATGGRHRLTAMFLENVSEVKLQIYKIKDSKEFNFTQYGEYFVRKGIEEGKIKGKIEENPDHSKKLVLDKPLENPLQLFGDPVFRDELLDVLAQTL